MTSPGITAITSSLPPETDYLTYLTIVESHLSPDLLPTLNNLLQDPELTQNIGWDLIQLLLPLPGAEPCLNTIARLGNPREVILKVTEALQILDLDVGAEHEHDTQNDDEPAVKDIGTEDVSSAEPTTVDKFSTLISLLSILHPRIKTKYPSRFLSTSLMAVLSAYRPTSQATSAVIAFVHALSGKKRPQVPRRASSFAKSLQVNTEGEGLAPDPEATEEDPKEDAIQKKLLQSFVTHIIEEFVNANELEWSTRLQERFAPEKVVLGRTSVGEAFKNDPTLQDKDVIVGQLVAIARDLGLSTLEVLFEAIYTEQSPLDNDSEEETPSSPEDVPLSRGGSLFLVTYFIFSAKLFDTTDPLPPISIFPGHAKLVTQFLGTNGPATVGTEELGVVDSILAIGLSLENDNKFVSGPLEDEDFLQHLQTLSLLSANTPSPSLRYNAHLLTSSILHAHPVDRVRLTFIIDTLEHCPYENLKASAVGWLKEEIIIAQERKSDSVFSSTVAVASAQPYLFPNLTALGGASSVELWDELRQGFPYHMAILNFIYLVTGDAYSHTLPSGALTVAEEIYLGPLRAALSRLEVALKEDGDLQKTMDNEDAQIALSEVHLLVERLTVSTERIAAQ